MKLILLFLLVKYFQLILSDDEVYSCGGFIQSQQPINFDSIKVRLYTSNGNLKYETDCAPHNGYYMIPVYTKGTYKLKVEPPAGWGFEPNEIEITINGVDDACTRGVDLNFKFNGFSVVGKACSDPSCTMPVKNLRIGLFENEAAQKPILLSVTNQAGEYTFGGVATGKFIAKLIDNKSVCSKQSSVDVKVSDTTYSVSSVLIVTGFSAEGLIENQGQPVLGATVYLFSDPINKQKFVCNNNQSILPDELKEFKFAYSCSTMSTETGGFDFQCLSTGSYRIKVGYELNGVKFDITPHLVDFSVNDSPIKLFEPFKISGFSLSGRVLWTDNTKPIKGATVKVNGKDLPEKTDAHGFYQLKKLIANKYEITATLDNVQFPTLKVDLSVKSHQIPVLKPEKLNLCGKIKIDTAEDEKLISRRRTLLLTNLQNKQDIASISALANGEFCRMTSPGKYSLEPQLLPEEKSAGILLNPQMQEISLIDSPIINVLFEQFKASASGTVKCIGACGDLKLSLSLDSNPNKVLQEVQEKTEKYELPFKFDNLISSRYTINPSADRFCWKKSRIGLKIDNSNVENLLLEQTGFSITIHISHSATLTYKNTKNKSHNDKIKLNKGRNKFCLPEHGIYEFQIESCHLFTLADDRSLLEEAGHNRFIIDSKYDTLTFNAKMHKVKGHIVTREKVDEISMIIRDTVSDVADKSVPVLFNNETQKYGFEFNAQSDSEFAIIPVTQMFILEPEQLEIKVKDECMTDLKFEAQKGVFFEGQITPVLEGVEVVLLRQSEEVYNTHTDSDGKFSIGPLKSLDEYDVKVEKVGYTFTPVEGRPGSFRGFKLSELILKATDSKSGKTLPNVLLSLSGKNYRSNNLTSENGSITFVGLTPGEYYIKPILKEYSFEPATKLVKVEEGSAVTVELTGQRVAYSCMGLVRHLAGQPVPNVGVEAVPVGPECQNTVAHEEALTGDDGSYRLRGLVPGCSYRLQVKPGQDVPKRTVPDQYAILVGHDDILGRDLIVKPEITTMEIAGRVDCDQSLLQYIKIVLYKENAQESPIHVVAMHSASAFFFPALPIDDTTYIVRLQHSLSNSKFGNLDYPEVVVKADRSFHHVDFSFYPKKKIAEPETLRGSYIAIPLTFLIMVLAYNYEKILPFLREVQSAIVAFSARSEQSENKPGLSRKGSQAQMAFSGEADFDPGQGPDQDYIAMGGGGGHQRRKSRGPGKLYD